MYHVIDFCHNFVIKFATFYIFMLLWFICFYLFYDKIITKQLCDTLIDVSSQRKLSKFQIISPLIVRF
jgi:hypothetical protein